MRNPRPIFLIFAAAPLSAACEPAETAPAPASIRDTDFVNFRYDFQGTSWTLRDSVQEPVRENGIVKQDGYLLDDVVYGDVTGDGVEEALVVVGGVTGGSAVPHWVFVYGAGPRPLWSFETGDRSAGGLNRVYADSGMLVVELFGRGKVPGAPDLLADDGSNAPACCPTVFTRSRYAWNGREFVPHGAPQVLPYDPRADG
jgi:hypothetical protein